jgi:MFS family permease
VLISLAVLSLSVLMPAVARDLEISPKLVGAFTAVTYAIASGVALWSAAPISRLGAVRVCQFAMLAAAVGLALNAAAFVAATVVAVAFIGFAQGPINPASAHILSQRVPRAWFSLVFSVKQTGVRWASPLPASSCRCCCPRWDGRAPRLQPLRSCWSAPAFWNSCERGSMRLSRPPHRHRESGRPSFT